MQQARGTVAEAGRCPLVPTRGPVLVVEDDEILRPFLVAVLESAGFEVVTASTGEAALELLVELEVSLLILEANISYPSSGELLRRLRRRVGSHWPPILCLVMPGQSSLRQIARGLGVHEFITEPFEPAALVRAAGRLVDRRAIT